MKIAHAARRPRRVRVGVRAGALLAVLVLVGAIASIVALRQHSGREQATAAMISDVRVDVASAESVQWQSLVEGAPDFTFQESTRALSAQLLADERRLRRQVSLNSANQRVLALIEGYRASLAREQSAVAAHRLAYGRRLASTDVTPTAVFVNDALQRLGGALRARASAGQTAADHTALGIGAAAVALIGLLSVLIGRTRRRAAASARGMLRANERRMRSLVQNSTDVVLIVDPDSTVTYVTDSVERVLGSKPASLLGHRLTERLGEDARAQLEAALHRLAAPGHAASTAVWPIRHAGGHTLAMEATAANMLLEPSVAGLVITLRDVTERRALEEQLRHQAFHDPLTGLANRALFEDRVRHGLQRLARVPGELSILLIDLDDFKTVNDSLGHAAGDRLLLEVATRMHACLRTSDTVARLGGDEFAVLIEDPAVGEGSAEELAGRLLDCVGRPLELEGRFLSIHASAGVAHRSELGTSADELMRNADIALYAAKDDGKSPVRAFEPQMLDVARQRLSLREDLQGALERDELRVVYQPITDLRDNSVHSLEALLRWEHPQDGVISPADFIPLAEQTIGLGMIVLVGLGLRVYFVEAWRPALVGFPDSAVYVNDAIGGIFNGPLRVGGYSEFLRLMHAVRPHLSFAIVVQHVLGLASGLLLFGAVRRAGVSGWAALLAAAVVILGGSELFIEHAPLTEATFIFCADLALYALVRTWAGARSWPWAIIAGAALGIATDLRTVGLLLLPVLVGVTALASPRRWSQRVLCAAVALVVAAVPIEAYLYFHRQSQGYGGFTGAGYFDLYGRVAPFADCSKFTPPTGTAKLCIHVPPAQRPGHDVWEFTGISPAVQAYGEPDLTAAKPTENPELRSFAEAAVLGQPGRYLQYVARDLVRVIDPTYPSSPYGAAGPTGMGYGNTPESLLAYYFNPGPSATIQHVLTTYYPGDGTVHRDMTFLAGYERHTRIDGPAMVILLLLALAAPLLTTGAQRRASLLLAGATVVLLVGPIVVSEYDYRFTIPAFGPLSATAAIGVWGAVARLRGRTTTSHEDGPPRTTPADITPA